MSKKLFDTRKRESTLKSAMTSVQKDLFAGHTLNYVEPYTPSFDFSRGKREDGSDLHQDPIETQAPAAKR